MYWDGEKVRRKDPMVLQMALTGHPEFNPATHPTIMFEDNQMGKDAYDLCLGAWRSTFEMAPFSDEEGVAGATDIQVIQVYKQFSEFIGDQKKSTDP